MEEKTCKPTRKECPMRFNGPMVRALLAGRKTQTRRIVKDLPDWEITEICYDAGGTGKWMPNGPSPSGRGMAAGHWRLCPYGQPGDRIWVRETLGYKADTGHFYAATGMHVGAALDYELEPPPSVGLPARVIADAHMPRWACRIQLEIVSVRVERVNECSETDALAEGIKGEACDHVRFSCEEIGCCGPTAKGMYAALWDVINGAGSWAANPWVWVIQFKRVTP